MAGLLPETGTDPVQQVNKRADFIVRKRREDRLIRLVNAGIELCEEPETAGRDVAKHLPPILSPLSPNEVPPLEAVDQPRDARGAVGHPLGDRQGGESALPSAAEDPEDAVLLQGESGRLDDATELLLDPPLGAKEDSDGLLAARLELPPGPVVGDWCLLEVGHQSRYESIIDISIY